MNHLAVDRVEPALQTKFATKPPGLNTTISELRGEHIFHLGNLGAHHRNRVRGRRRIHGAVENARFCARDLFDRVSQELLVIQAHRGEHAHLSVSHIR